MFGTLDSRRERLDFVENPDPVAAVSRNIQDKVHIACILCRSRKVRCSGERNGCDRCTAAGVECIFADQQNKQKRKDKKRRTTSVANAPTQSTSREDIPRPGSDMEPYEEMVLDEINDLLFEGTRLDDALLSPWLSDSPADQSVAYNMSHRNDGDLSSNSKLNAQDYEFASNQMFTIDLGRQAGLQSTVSSPSVSLLSPPATRGTSEMNSSDKLPSIYGDIFQMPDLQTKEQKASKNSTQSVSNQRSRQDSSSCSCLMSSVTLLERLAARSASHENRLDALLTDVRHSIDTLASFIECSRCATRAEQNMLIAVAVRQMSVVCKKMVHCYKDMYIRYSHLISANDERLDSDSSGRSVDVSVATYRVTSREKLFILSNLVALQVSELQRHVNTIKSRCRGGSDPGLEKVLKEVDSHLQSARAVIRAAH